jgi:antitoxin ParD1/3/4
MCSFIVQGIFQHKNGIIILGNHLVDYQNLVTLLKLNVMGKNTSISLGNHFESFIETTVSIGRFNNASEVVRAGLRLLEEEENRITLLRNAISEGIESGRATDFDPKKHLETLKSGKKNG